MLLNERFALACRAWYEEQGLVVDEKNGEFAHCPLPERYGSAGYYLLHEHHQHQGLLQSKDIGECCFFAGHTKKWLKECDPLPDNYFELWDIYEKYQHQHSSKNGKQVMDKLHSEKNQDGKSKLAVKNGKKAGYITLNKKLGLFDPANCEKVREGNVRGCRKAGALRAKPIELTNILTGETYTFPSAREASRSLGLNQGNLGQCTRGVRPTCQGFTARYI